MALSDKTPDDINDTGHPEEEDINVDTQNDAPVRYVSLDRVYGSSTVISNTKPINNNNKPRNIVDHNRNNSLFNRPPLRCVYSRRGTKRQQHCSNSKPFFESVLARGGDGGSAESNALPNGVGVKMEACEVEELVEVKKTVKKRKIGSGELMRLGSFDSGVLQNCNRLRSRDSRNHVACVNNTVNNDNGNGNSKCESVQKKKRDSMENGDPISPTKKRWVR